MVMYPSPMLALAAPFVSIISRKNVAVNGLSYTDNLLVDSASANTWIGTRTKYVPTSTSVNMDQPMSIGFQDNKPFIGMTYKDIISCHINTYVRKFVHRHSHSQSWCCDP